MLLLLLNYVVLRALRKIDVNVISTLVDKGLYYYLLLFMCELISRIRTYLSAYI